MRELLPSIRRWQGAGNQVALATVVQAWGSAPRPIGAQMAISQAGDMEGSVSGGCVEGAVYETAQQVMTQGRPQWVSFGVSNEDAWAVGLTCGGTIAIFVEPLPSPVDALAGDALPLAALAAALDAERPALLATLVDDGGGDSDGDIAGPSLGAHLLVPAEGEAVGSLGHPELDQQVRQLAAGHLASQRSQLHALTVDDTTYQVFLHAHPPRKRLIVVGAVHVAIPLLHFARQLGFRTIVVDPRTAFATAERFPHVDEIRTDWPDKALNDLALDESSFVALLSHDLKLDIPALEIALRRPVRYLGALGSRKTHAKRLAALEERGFTAEDTAHIHNPIGLDLGGRRAEEIAVAIIAEMVAVDHGRDSKS